jgi:uncharacterized protein YndB with AHSA1/START domain
MFDTEAARLREILLEQRAISPLLNLGSSTREFREVAKPHIQRALFGPLAAIGRRRGYRPWYEAYSGPDVERLSIRRGDEAGDAGYVFVDEWDVDAPIEAVFDAIADARTYPAWWRPVYLDVEADGPAALGKESRQHFKGRLPYHLNTRSVIVALDPPHTITGEVDGDLRGRGTWTLTPSGAGTHVRFDWQVHADRRLLKLLTPILRPALRWNHAWAIARAIEGLEPYAQQRAMVAA